MCCASSGVGAQSFWGSPVASSPRQEYVLEDPAESGGEFQTASGAGSSIASMAGVTLAVVCGSLLGCVVLEVPHADTASTPSRTRSALIAVTAGFRARLST